MHLFSSLFHALTLLLTQYGYPALFAMLVLGLVGLPIPDEPMLMFCGYLIYAGRLKMGLTFLVGILGSTCGITISYLLGIRFGSMAVARFGKYIFVTPERVASVEVLFQRYGSVLLTVGYFIPGVRHFTAIVAGMSGVPVRRFVLFAYSGAVLWIGTFLMLGYKVGEQWEQTSEVVHHYVMMGTLVIAGAIFVIWITRRLYSFIKAT